MATPQEGHALAAGAALTAAFFTVAPPSSTTSYKSSGAAGGSCEICITCPQAHFTFRPAISGFHLYCFPQESQMILAFGLACVIDEPSHLMSRRVCRGLRK